MKKKRILILGSYGCGNRGDEAILDSIALYFRDCDITATCGKDRRIQGDIPISYIDCRLAEGKVTFEIFLSFVKSVFQLFCKILSVDAVIFGGGSSLHDLKAYNLPFWLGLQLWANLFGKKTYYVGMGIGPISTGFGKFLCKHFLRHADKVFVRDQRGIDICLSLGLRNIVLANDAAFSKPLDRRETAGFFRSAHRTVYLYFSMRLGRFRKLVADRFRISKATGGLLSAVD